MILSCACSLVSSAVLPIYLHTNHSQGQLRVATAVQNRAGRAAYGANDGEAGKETERATVSSTVEEDVEGSDLLAPGQVLRREVLASPAIHLAASLARDDRARAYVLRKVQ